MRLLEWPIVLPVGHAMTAAGTPPRARVESNVKNAALVADSLIGLFAMATRTDNEIRELTPEQGQQLLDDKARQYLGISGEEFRTRWEAGEIDADDEPDVMRVAMLLPLAS